MADITKCSGEGCKMKDKCHRHTAPGGIWQFWFMKPPVENGECDYFLEKQTQE